jgi:hypothetical protein
VEEVLARLTALYPMTVTPWGAGWHVRLAMRDNFICELHVGPDALDWYAGVLDPADGRELWSDWMDYLGYDKRPKVQLIEEKQRDLASFVESWITATGVRVVRRRKAVLLGLLHTTRIEVEWERAATWQPIRIWEELPPNKRMQPTAPQD